MSLFLFDNAIAKETGATLCGVDEAGRGPLAGPVCAAAVILPQDCVLEGLNDSKKLTEKKRDTLFDEITANALAYGIAVASVPEIEQLNILQAAMLAMRRAVEIATSRAAVKLPGPPVLALVDGNADPGFAIPTRLVVGGDGKSACIAAASVLAKVTRDRMMLELEEKFPQYGFKKHKGYGTKAHYAALDQFGPCEIHRESFLKKWRAAR